jgi:hypothetical protein
VSLPPVALTAWSSLTPAPMDVYQAMTIGSISGGLSLGAAQPQLILIVIAGLALQVCDEVQQFLPAVKRAEPRHIVLMANRDPQGLRSIL